MVDVGDGACSVLRCGCHAPCDHGVAVIDCGNWLGSSSSAARQLASALGGDLARLRQIVVSHFDWDHWGGLRELAPAFGQARSGHPRASVDLFYPAVPESAVQLPAETLAVVATVSGTGVRAMELATAWGAFADVQRIPLSLGSSFGLVGHRFTALWPPNRLPVRLGGWIGDSLQELEQLANELAEAGSPALRTNLNEAYPTTFPPARPESSDRREPVRDMDYGRDEKPGDIGAEDLVIEEEGIASGHVLDDVDTTRIPDEFAQRFRNLARRLGRANNLLSLVIHDSNREMIAFGDVQGWALRECLRGTHRFYHLILAPHHGTERLPPGFPLGGLCVSQSGPRHHRRWYEHVHTHSRCRIHCVSTYDTGDIVWLR